MRKYYFGVISLIMILILQGCRNSIVIEQPESIRLLNVAKSDTVWTRTSDWYKDVLCKVHLDMHFPEWDSTILSRFDAKEIVQTVKNSGAGALYFFSKDCYGNAYYNTEIGHKHKCIGDRDLLQEVVDEGHKNNLYIVAYHSIIWDRIAAMNPDWAMRNPNGEVIKDVTSSFGDARWYSACHNSPYRDYLCNMLAEIAKNYDIDGFHLDMLNMDFGGLSCYCKHCKELFRKEYGKELPVTPTWDETWKQFLEFRYKSVERLAYDIRKAIHKYKPDMMIVTNYHGSPGFDWRVGQMPVRHSKYSDMNTGETYTPGFGDMYPGMETRFARDLEPGKPYEMVPWRMNRITDYTIKPINQLRWELFTSAVAGAKIMLIDQPFADGVLDKTPYKNVLNTVFNELETKKHTFGGEQVKHIGIYYSALNRDWYGRENQGRFQAPVVGCYKALVENHFNVNFIFDETLSLENICEYPIIWLPNVAAMSSGEVEIFREYVKRGGCLVGSFDSSLFDDNGQELQDFQLGDVFGVQFEKRLDCSEHYFRNISDDLNDNIDKEQFVLVEGKAVIVKPTTAKEIGDLHNSFHKRKFPDLFFSHNMHPPYNRVGGLMYLNSFGKGKALYIASPIDAAYAGNYEIPEHRFLIKSIVENLSPCPVLEIVEAPLNVETFLNLKNGKYYLHFVASNPNRQACTLSSLNDKIRPSARMEDALLYRAKIKIPKGIKSVRAFDSSTELEIKDGFIIMETNQVHEVLIFE